MSAKGRYLLMRDAKKEDAELQKKARKKGLWGSIGRTIGSLAVMGLTGGAVNPLTLGLLTAGGSFLGGAVGAKASGTGDLSKQGRFFKDDREELQDTLGAFGSENITSSLKSGVTAGMGQAATLQKAKMFGKGTSEAAKLSDGFGMDFEGSMVGKNYGKLSSSVGKGYGQLKDVVGKGLEKVSDATAGGPPKFRGAPWGDSSFAADVAEKPFPLKYGDQKVSAWDKFKDFVDVSDIKEERALMGQIEEARKIPLTSVAPTESVEHKLGIGTGYDPKWGYRPSTWKPEEGSWLRDFYDRKWSNK